MAQSDMPVLEVSDLCMHFTSGRGKKKITVRAVDGVSFTIGQAETFGLVGESGCGKTTCGRAIIRLYTPTSGKIVVKGRDLSGRLSKEDRRFLTDNVAMIFQDPIESLNPRMTIEEIVSEGLTVKGKLDRSVVRKRVYETLEQVGLTQEHATRYPHEFSGGQRQRVGIARALINRPSLIIADEPVSALDVSIQAQVINLLNDLKRDLGLSILFIAHDLSVVKYFSDKIGVMYFGKMVELAEGDELYHRPTHPYTKSLLSAVPRPNPLTEPYRGRVNYEPEKQHDYSHEQPRMAEIRPGHFVWCSPTEERLYKQQLNE